MNNNSILSVNEVRLSGIFDDIKQQIAQNQPPPQKKVANDNRIDIGKLGPFLEGLQTISNHNLAAATVIQQENVQLQQQLQNETQSNKAIKKELHHVKKSLQKLQEVHSLTQLKLNNEVSLANHRFHEAQGVAQNKEIESEHLAKQLRQIEETNKKFDSENKSRLNEKTNRERELIIQLQESQSKNEVWQVEVDKLKESLNSSKMRSQQLEFSLDRLKSLQIQEQANIEARNVEWINALQNRENKLEIEIRNHENKRSELTAASQKVMELESEAIKLRLENEAFKKENIRLAERNEKLQRDADINFQNKIKDINESFIVRLTNLEAQLQESNKDSHSHVQKISQLTHQLRVSDASKDILKKECDEFEISMDNIRREKLMYLNEFRFLKEKYQQTIDQLENEGHKLRLVSSTLAEDAKSSKATAEHYKSRMQELLDLHEVAALDQEEAFYHILQMIKGKGMENITKEEMEMARQDAMAAMAMNKTVKLVKQQLQTHQYEFIDDPNDGFINQDTKIKNVPMQKINDDPWNDLFYRIDNIGSK